MLSKRQAALIFFGAQFIVVVFAILADVGRWPAAALFLATLAVGAGIELRASRVRET